MYFVYLIRCRGDTLYAGITTDLPRRMRQHRGELPGGAKYTRFPPKIAAMQKSLFQVVENSNFLNRLRNGHLEKSVATGICRVQRSPKTAKTPRKVHLRLRFQNPGKPRTAGL